MQRIETLLQKLKELSAKNEKNTIIDIDLMLDYTRVLYADLLELRIKIAAAQPAHETLNTKPADVHFTPPKHVIDLTPKKAHSTADIRHNIGINDKYQYISELFLNNKDAYEILLNEINSFEEYKQAFYWVQKNYNWDEESDTTISFYNTLNNFFSGR